MIMNMNYETFNGEGEMICKEQENISFFIRSVTYFVGHYISITNNG